MGDKIFFSTKKKKIIFDDCIYCLKLIFFFLIQILKHWVSVFKILDWTTQNGSTNLIVIFKTESYESLSNLTWDICDVDKIRPDSDDNVDEDVDAASDGDSTGLQSAKIALKAQLLVIL